jgi:hypothetical protein
VTKKQENVEMSEKKPDHLAAKAMIRIITLGEDSFVISKFPPKKGKPLVKGKAKTRRDYRSRIIASDPVRARPEDCHCFTVCCDVMCCQGRSCDGFWK